MRPIWKIIVQARLEGTRLPGKVWLPVAGQPLLLRLLDRLRSRFAPEQVLVALAHTEAAAELARRLRRHGHDVVIPEVPAEDVLARYAAVAEQYGLSRVVRVTGDCPLIDPDVVQQAIDRFAVEVLGGARYVALGREWPDGLDVEVIDTGALFDAEAEVTEPLDREHVTPFIWRQPERFRQVLVPCPLDLSRHKWSVDTAEDLGWAGLVYAACAWTRGARFGWRDVLSLLEARPDLLARATRQPRNGAFVEQWTAAHPEAVPPCGGWEALRYQEG